MRRFTSGACLKSPASPGASGAFLKSPAMPGGSGAELRRGASPGRSVLAAGHSPAGLAERTACRGAFGGMPRTSRRNAEPAGRAERGGSGAMRLAMSVDSSFVGGGAAGRVVGSPAGRLTVLPFFFVDTTITGQRGRGHTRVMNQLSVVCHRTGIVLLFFFPPDARAGGDGSTRRQHATPAWKN